MELPITLGKYLQRLDFTHPVNWSIQLTEGKVQVSLIYTDKDPSLLPGPPGSGSTLCKRTPSLSGPRLGRNSTAEPVKKTRPAAKKPRIPKRKSPSTKKRDNMRLQAFLEKKTGAKGKPATTPPATHNLEPSSLQTAPSPEPPLFNQESNFKRPTDAELKAMIRRSEELEKDWEAEKAKHPIHELINTTTLHSPLKEPPEKLEDSLSNAPPKKKAKQHQRPSQTKKTQKRRNCPPSLASSIAHAIYQEISGIDFTDYVTDDLCETDNTCIGNAENDIIVNIPCMESNRLAKLTLTKLHDICFKWNKELPKIRIPDKIHTVSSHCIKNSRRKMEDKHVILQDVNNLFNLKDTPSHSYFAVFDGHAGTDAANYAASHLHCNLVRGDNFHKDISEAIIDSYKTTDKNFSYKARREHLNSGTTCVSALFQGSTVHISWLGDSQAVLVRDGQAVSVMNPHKPNRKDETERIEKLGGSVIFYGTWRVNGNIAVSRAIGDVSQKPFICSDADVTSISLDGTEDYLVLACDGAWDMISIPQLPEIVYSHLQEPGGSKSTVAKHIIKYANDRGSSDNITVIVVFLREDISKPKPFPLETEVSENGGERSPTDKNDKDSSNEKKSKKGDNFQNSQRHISGSANDKRITQNYECSLSPSRALIYVDIKKKFPFQEEMETFCDDRLSELYLNEIVVDDNISVDTMLSASSNHGNTKKASIKRSIPLTVALPVLVEQSALRLYQTDTVASKNWKRPKQQYISTLKDSITGKENLKKKCVENSSRSGDVKLENTMKEREKSNVCWSFIGKSKGGLAPRINHRSYKSKRKPLKKSTNFQSTSFTKTLESIVSRITKQAADNDDVTCMSSRPLPGIQRNTSQKNANTDISSTSQVVTSLVFGSMKPADHDIKSDAFYSSRSRKTKKGI